MNNKEKRQWLRDNGHRVPRSIVELEYEFSEKHDGVVLEDTNISIVDKSNINEYTYVGFGPESPSLIKFMGLQVFTRGLPTEVTNPVVLEKIKNHRCFVQGKADMDAVHAAEEEAKKRVAKIRQRDIEMQIMADRQNRG